MFTVCPKCSLTLVVTAADLRVAQGYVRCGRCSNVFNALARLSEDRQSAAAAAQNGRSAQPQTEPRAQTQAQPAAPTEPPSRQNGAGTETQPAARSTTPPTQSPVQARSAPPAATTPPARATAQAVDDEEDDSIPESALEFNPEATDVTKLFVEQAPDPQWTAATGSFKAIMLREEDMAPPPEPVKQPAANASKAASESKEEPGTTDTQFDVEIDPELLVAASALNRTRRADATMLESDGESVASTVEAPQQTRGAPQAKTTPQWSQPQPAQTPAEPRATPRPAARASSSRLATDMPAPQRFPRERARTAGRAPEEVTAARLAAFWSIGTGALVIILAAQIVNHYRNDLAANPRLNGPLTALYSALGVPLVPRWDLHAYDVRQLGASVDSATSGQITVRASVKNGARQAQPMPLLRVTLQDRFGNRIAARDVPPRSYLPAAIPPSSYLSAGQRIDAEMAFVDPGSNAVGFEIDACLPAPAGGISCANDPGVR